MVDEDGLLLDAVDEDRVEDLLLVLDTLDDLAAEDRTDEEEDPVLELEEEDAIAELDDDDANAELEY